MQKLPAGLTPVLFIPGLVYQALTRARNGLYSAGALPQHRLPEPVISVGNITMGGTGKTPLVIHIAQMLDRLGCRPAVLSRGYGRAEPHRHHILSPGESIPLPARNLGDEPAVMRRHLPSAWMGISKNRFFAGSMIARRQRPIVFVLDDGFQHRGLHRDLDIVLIDPGQPLEANRIFPRGTLRESLAGLRRCQIVMINGAPAGDKTDSVAEEVLRHNPRSTIFRCKQTIRSLVPFPEWKEEASRNLPGTHPESAYLVAALGNPQRFERDIRQFGVEVCGTRFFPDHHWLRPGDWTACVQEARRRNAQAIVTTEKDAIKTTDPPGIPLLVSVQETEIIDSNAFEAILKNSIGEHR